jgi:hypothetical protein
MKTHIYGSAKTFSSLSLSLSFIDKTLTTVEKKVMIHDPKQHNGDEINKAKQVETVKSFAKTAKWNAASVLSWDC